MSDFNNDAGDSYEALTKAALLLEGRNLRDRTITFPDGPASLLGASSAVAHGGTVTGDALGALLYYVADIMENIKNWK